MHAMDRAVRGSAEFEAILVDVFSGKPDGVSSELYASATWRPILSSMRAGGSMSLN